MNYPSSLSSDVKKRAFVSSNGELGVCPNDVQPFLDACRRDHIEVLGWDLWIVDHAWATDGGPPVQADGLWCGGIPIRGDSSPTVIGGEGDADATERQLANFDLNDEVDLIWQPYLRVNFTLGDRLPG